MPDDWLRPTGLGEHVGAIFTTRSGGVSQPPYRSLNLGAHVFDDPRAVQVNRARLRNWLGGQPVFLEQVHGCRVLSLGADSQLAGCGDAEPAAWSGLTATPSAALQADASYTTERGVVCCVLVADCLPVLLAAPHGRGVAAAHAGWRGLAAGVLDETVAALCRAAACEPRELRAWLGPCIGPSRFEVGSDVLDAFGVGVQEASARFRPARASRWWADLPGLAGDRLSALGLVGWSGGEWCTVGDERFFSYRRDGITGRMAACIWLR